MSEFIEFHAKNLDQAIDDACRHFDAERVKLEIEILEDAKTGIFGLVGARKARIQARLAQLPSVSLASSSKDEKKRAPAKSAKAPSKAKPAPKTRKSAVEEAEKLVDKANDLLEVEERAPQKAEESQERTRAPRQPRARQERESSRDAAEERKPRNSRTQRDSYSDFDEEEGESQRQFLSKIAHPEEEVILDDHILEAMDRKAMAKANLHGNATEAEIRATGNYSRQENGRGKYPKRNDRNDRNDRYERKDRFERTERADRPERTDRHETRGDKERGGYKERNQHKKERFERPTRERSERPDYRQERYSQERAPQKEAFKYTGDLSPEEIKLLDPQDRRSYYMQKRQAERDSRPPKQIVVQEYDAPPLPRVALTELDQEKLIAVTTDTIRNLVGPIVGFDAPISVQVFEDKVQITIDSEDTGLLIGKEGQHLAAVQYIATRIITRQMETQLRIQVDTGDYHSRQDARMEFLANSLAEKVKAGGRPLSTKPLSAYQRRIIHLTLQDDEQIQTRSCGEGSLKRVIIMRKRVQQNQEEHEASEAIDAEAMSSQAMENIETFESFDENDIEQVDTDNIDGEAYTDDDDKDVK